MGVISFQKIFGLCGLKGHIVEIRWDVTLVHIRTYGRTECEDRARILKQNSQKCVFVRQRETQKSLNRAKTGVLNGTEKFFLGPAQGVSRVPKTQLARIN